VPVEARPVSWKLLAAEFNKMMVAFGFLDWLWVALYLLIMVGAGVLFYRLGRRGESDFFLAGRGLPWWLPAASVYATHTATDTPMWVSGVIYRHGLTGLWYSFFAAWCAISAFVSTRIFRRSLAYTQAEWNTVRFSGLGAELLRGWMSGWQVFMSMFILGWVGIAMGKVCQYVFGWPTWVGLVLFSSVCAVYVMASGYWGVIMADFLQGVIAFAVILLVSLWGVVAAGGPSAIVSQLAARGEEWRLNPFAFSGWFTGDFPIAWFATMLFIALLGGFGMGTSIDWYVEAQRIQSARTVRDASYSIWWGTALVLMRNSIWAVAILGFYVLYPQIQNTAEYEMAWFRIGFDFLPAGMLGFFFAGIIAIHISTISAILNLGAMYFTRDLYLHYWKQTASERELVWVGRIATVLLLVGSFFYGLMMEEITSWLIFALWIMAAGIWLPNILQVVWWRFNAWGYLASWIANLGLSWLVVWVLPSFGLLPELPDYQQFWVLMILGAVIYLPVTLLTPPDEMDHLVRYYVMSRPIGWWGPVRREAERRGLLRPVPAA
jgi:SSS family solute:Na+ symporter